MLKIKEKLIEDIKNYVETYYRNGMGCSENWYNYVYAIKQTFTIEEIEKMTTKEIREYIQELKRQAREKGKTSIILRSGNIHKELNLKHRMPAVGDAMWQCKEPCDLVLHTTESGQSSTIEIEYKL